MAWRYPRRLRTGAGTGARAEQLPPLREIQRLGRGASARRSRRPVGRVQQDAGPGRLFCRRPLLRRQGTHPAQPAVPPLGALPSFRRLRARGLRSSEQDRDPDDLAAADAAVPEVLRHARRAPAPVAAGNRRRPAGTDQRRGHPGRIPQRVRYPGERPAAVADRLRIQDQGAGPQPEGPRRPATDACQALPTDRHRRR
jgi:hypothetical protein